LLGPYSQKVIPTIVTLKRRKKEIHVSELLKTLQDAVRATRMLKLDCLLVDSLYILQQNPNSQGSGAEDAQILDDFTTKDQLDEIPRCQRYTTAPTLPSQQPAQKLAKRASFTAGTQKLPPFPLSTGMAS
jgi:hypothetical protein